MIKLSDFLKIANDPVCITDGVRELILISDRWFENDILSKKTIRYESCDSRCWRS